MRRLGLRVSVSMVLVRNNRSHPLCAVAILAICGVLACVLLPIRAANAESVKNSVSLKALGFDRGFGLWPLPDPPKLDSRKVDLGRRLFHDPKLSGTGTISCASCHDLKSGGDDGQIKSIGVTGKPTLRNSPTVFNTALHSTWFWDGRAVSLEDQIDGPIHHPDEMGSNWPHIVKTIRSSRDYVKSFDAVYSGKIDQSTIKNAIATFEKSLVTPDSPLDRYLKGNRSAMSPRAVAGFGRFRALGCISCHQGTLLGGNLFQKIGIFRKFGLFGKRPQAQTADNGRYRVTKDEADRHLLKVPSLRNVALTAPYFHDGSAATLEAAIELMAYYQLGRTLSDEEIKDLVAFLESLTGRINLSSIGKEIPNGQTN